MSGITGTQAELLYTLSSSITKNTFSTQAAITGVLGTNTVCAIPGGWLYNDVPQPLGRSLLLEIWGTVGNTASATLATALGLDPTAGTINQSIATMAATAPPVAAGAPFYLWARYTCTAFATSTCTYQVNGRIGFEGVASGGAGSAGALESGFTGTHAGIDPRITNYVELFGTWSASSASNTTTIQQMFLWGLN
jgi:hypothetical protein